MGKSTGYAREYRARRRANGGAPLGRASGGDIAASVRQTVADIGGDRVGASFASAYVNTPARFAVFNSVAREARRLGFSADASVGWGRRAAEAGGMQNLVSTLRGNVSSIRGRTSAARRRRQEAESLLSEATRILG